MKILQVISSFPPAFSYGGPAKVAYDISKELVKRGHEVTVYTTDAYDAQSRLAYKENPMWMDGIEVYHFKNVSNKFASKNYSISPMMALALNKNIRDFDVIHLHDYRSVQAAFVQHYANKYSVPYVLQAHGSTPIIIKSSVTKWLFDVLAGNKIIKNASKLIAVSNAEVAQYMQRGGDDKQIIVIPNGIDLDQFNDLPEKGTFRKQYGISDKYIILFLGRLHERKGIGFLIKSYAELVRDIDDVMLILAGPDEGFKYEAEKMIDQLNLKNKVVLTGYLDGNEKIAAYVDADVLVYPSIFEIFGLVPFEAIMCGTPVIVTDDCGCGDLVKEAKCGYLVKYGNVNDLKDKMKLVIENPEEGKKKVCKGREYVEMNLTWNNIIKKDEKLYDENTT